MYTFDKQKFLWVLKKDGTVHQFPMSYKKEEETGNIFDYQISNKKRQISSLKDIKQISSGIDHFVALDKSGRVFTMGDDTLGQCGLGDDGRLVSGPFFEKRVPTPHQVQSRPPLHQRDSRNRQSGVRWKPHNCTDNRRFCARMGQQHNHAALA